MPKRRYVDWKEIVLQIILLPFIVGVWLGVARGSFVPSTRPINMSYAGDYVSKPGEIALVLNTPFSILTTLGNIKVPAVHYFPTLDDAAKVFNPVQSYNHPDKDSIKRKNVVIFVVESLSREFVGALNDNKNYEYYTPFFRFTHSALSHV